MRCIRYKLFSKNGLIILFDDKIIVAQKWCGVKFDQFNLIVLCYCLVLLYLVVVICVQDFVQAVAMDVVLVILAN